MTDVLLCGSPQHQINLLFNATVYHGASMSEMTILCMSSYEKGQEFMRECKRRGWRVLLLTVEKLKDAKWPRESLDDVYLMPDLTIREQVINAVSYLARTIYLDRIVA